MHAAWHADAQVQMHSFNCPFQLASPTLWPQADTPDDADVYEVDLQPGDVLVLGSDGLFDNMWDSELELVLQQHLQVCLGSRTQSCLFWHALPPGCPRLAASRTCPAWRSGRLGQRCHDEAESIARCRGGGMPCKELLKC
jgi:hypothetical protein